MNLKCRKSKKFHPQIKLQKFQIANRIKVLCKTRYRQINTLENSSQNFNNKTKIKNYDINLTEQLRFCAAHSPTQRTPVEITWTDRCWFYKNFLMNNFWGKLNGKFWILPVTTHYTNFQLFFWLFSWVFCLLANKLMDTFLNVSFSLTDWFKNDYLRHILFTTLKLQEKKKRLKYSGRILTFYELNWKMSLNSSSLTGN